MKAISTLLISVLFLSPALAQDETPEVQTATEEIRRYTVEVVIFSYVEDVALGSEQFFPDDPVADEEPDEYEESLGLVDELSVPPARRKFGLRLYAENPELLKLEFLTEDEFTMTDITDKFDLLDVYQTIMHFGWTQPTLPEDETEAIALSSFGDVPDGLDGSLTLYRSRYLHLVVDLALEAEDDRAEEREPVQPVLSFGDSRYRYDDEPRPPEMPVYYRIQENRIVRNGDIRYFDHPKFGVVVKVTRVEAEEELPELLPGLTTE